jgi:tRNA G46 methylase TrmB
MTISLAPFIPSPHEIVKKMLELASVRNTDVVFDLGCGDGRILIAAVKDFGAKKAVGYELKEDLYKQAIREIKKQGLESEISIVNNDVFTGNLSEATVITLYLTTSGNGKLKPKLVDEANQDVRIISHDFEITGWYPTKKESFHGHTIYMYTISDKKNT